MNIDYLLLILEMGHSPSRCETEYREFNTPPHMWAGMTYRTSITLVGKRRDKEIHHHRLGPCSDTILEMSH